jgi:serine phosphatase RsbU (regulator of sigma subunit)
MPTRILTADAELGSRLTGASMFPFAPPGSKPAPRSEGETGNACQFAVPADLSAVRPGVLQAVEFLGRHGVLSEDLTACELALVEACNNAILYTADPSSPIGIELVCRADRVDLQVIDHTNGFEWPAHLDLPEGDAEHGRGLFLIQSVMDDALYLRSPRENRLFLRRQRMPIPRAAEPPAGQIGEVEKQLELSHQVLTSMASELYQQVMLSRIQQTEMDNRLLAHELEIARKIQESLLPKTFPVLPGFSLAGFCLSARQVGGDFYDLTELPDGRVLLAVADVMGKGVPAALFAATLRTLLRTAIQWTQKPSELLARINRLMHEELTAVDMFITAQLAIADPRKGVLQVASAGHNPLLCVTTEGVVKSISPEGMPLGILPEFVFEETTLPLRKVGAALMFTDGLTEARNQAGELFGQQRLEDWLVGSRRKRRTAAETADSFLAELTRFQGPASPRDDQTFLVMTQETPACPAPSSPLQAPVTAMS